MRAFDRSVAPTGLFAVLFAVIVAVVLTVPVSVFAKRVEPEKAEKLAQRFAESRQRQHGRPGRADVRLKYSARRQGHGGGGLRRGAAQQGTAADDVSYYVFNINESDNGGFVIVAADDVVKPVLGYSDNGKYDENDLPPNFVYWMEFLQSQIEWAQEQGLEQGAELAEEWDSFLSGEVPMMAVVVSPLITTTWNQTAPYNNLCPTDLYPSTSGTRTLTGCVATAMAQIMNYHKRPLQSTAVVPSDAYTTTSSLKLNMASEDLGGFEWDKMNTTTPGTSEQQAAVAKLMYHAGLSVKMNYNTSSSGTNSGNVVMALTRYFGYDNSIRFMYRNFYDDVTWENMLKTELNANRPVYYSGSNSSSGHAFVCDGYDNNGTFHFNWGWGGYQDGYFKTSVLNPGSGGAGSGSGTYNEDQAIITNIKHPNAGGMLQPYELAVYNIFEATATTVTPIDKFDVNFTIKNVGWKAIPFPLYVGGALVNSSSNDIVDIVGTRTITSSSNESLASGMYYDAAIKISNCQVKNAPAGTYNLKMVISFDGGTTYEPINRSFMSGVPASIGFTVQPKTWDCGAVPGTVTATLIGGKLTISGSGAMADYASGGAPWYSSLSYNSTYNLDLIVDNGVTKIGEYAFQTCTGLKSATISNSVASIGNYAFYYCTGLTAINCLANTPPIINGNPFYLVTKGNVCLKVPYTPTSSASAYSGNSNWNAFTCITTTSNTVSSIDFPAVTFNSSGGSDIAPQTVLRGDKLLRPADPTFGNYTFGGWYKSDKTTAWNFATDVVTSSTTLYAKWKVAKPALSQTAFVYDATDKTVALNPVAVGVYALGGDVTKKNAGNYTAIVTLSDKTNFVWSDGTATDLSLSWRIDKATPIVTAPIALTAVYGQTLAALSAQLPSASNDQTPISGTFAWVQSTSSTVGAVSASPNTSYTLTFTPTDGTNYNTVSNIATRITVSKAPGNFGTPAALSATYSSTLKLSDLNSQLSSGYAWNNSNTQITSAGNGKTFPATYTESSGNYEPATGNITVNVAKGTGLTATAPLENLKISTSNTNPNTFDLSTIVVSKNDHGGLSYSLGTFTDGENILTGQPTLSGSTLTYTGAGKTTGTATQVINIISQNYNDASVTITIVAIPKTAVTIGGLTKADAAYNGSQKRGYTGTATSGAYTGVLDYEYTGTSNNGTAYGPTATPPTNAGDYTLTVSVPESDPTYEGSASFSFIIAKANPTYNSPTGLTAVYGQTLADVTLPNSVSGSWLWDEPLTTSVGNAGTRAFNATFTPIDQDNYNVMSGISLSITVNKAAGTFVSHAALTTTYTSTLTLANLNLQLSPGYAWAVPATAITSAGHGKMFDATYTEPSGNYEPAAGKIAVNVDKATGLIATPPENIKIVASNVSQNTFNLSNVILNKTDHGPLGYILGTFIDGDGVLTAQPTLSESGLTLSYTGTGKSTGTATQVIIITSPNYNDATVTLTFEATIIPVYSVTVTNDGNGTASATPMSAAAGTQITLTASPSSGYQFKQWQVVSGGVTIAGSKFTMPANAVAIKAVFELIPPAVVYTVTFNANGGTVSPASGVTGVGGKLSSLPTPTRSGYLFEGWYTVSAATGGTEVTTGTAFTANATVYARWSLVKYVIIFDAAGGTVSPYYGMTGTGGKLSSLPSSAKRNGYTFVDWYTEEIGGKRVTTSTVFEGDATIYAHWTPVLYGITYNLNGGAVSPANPTSYTIETADFTLNNPTRIAYTFAGWTGANGTSKQTDVTVWSGSTGDKSFTANWTSNVYTITFDPNGSTVTTKTAKTVTGGKLSSLPSPAARTGYSFDGWYTEVTGGTKVTTSYVFGEDATVYARWTPTRYTITYNLNSGAVTQANPTSYTIETEDFMLNNPTRTAYTFAGWTGANGTVKQNDVSVKQGSTGNKTFTANWTGDVYTVTFDANGGSVSPATAKTAAGGKLTSLPTPTKVYDAFDGWYTSPSGGTKVTTSYVFGEDAVIYAQWTPVYTVWFNANGGTVSRETAGTGAGGKLTSLPTPTRSGYAFDGWYTERSGGAAVTTGTVFREDAEIYAHWKVSTELASPEREIPSGAVVEDAVVAPAVIEQSRNVGAVSVGPSPVKVGGELSLYRNGGKSVSGKLGVFDAMGQRVGSIDVNGTRKIGTWNVGDITEGTYLIKGVLMDRDGKKISVSLPVSVVR